MNQQDQQWYPYIIRLLAKDDLPQILGLQDFILSFLDNKSYFVPLSREEHIDIIIGNGESIGLFIGDKLYAVCSILFPGLREVNMARELDFNDEELLQVAQLELSMVHPDLRGNNLQSRLAQMLAQRAENAMQYKHLFTSISPYNYPSLKTATSIGLKIVKLCKMYCQWDRYVMYKDLENHWEIDRDTILQVPMDCLEKQQALLEDRFFGFTQYKDDEGVKLIFARKGKEW
ncbi:hypothetical protein [Heliorestis convoluta]|uniref:hypothetical protein n=1 Tax=Heliorestis convoluta TaxID=356322 RepID=UPI00129A456B|nr:hypothetical protein [Heliorestis convoluta]